MNEGKPEIIIGNDHAAFYLKEKFITYLKKNNIFIEDAGTFGIESVDYTDIAIKVASAVSTNKVEKGILMCGTGIGMSMAANRFNHIRAALCNDLFSASMSRRHNNSNILVIGGRIVGEDLAIAILDTWLNTSFEGGRHQRRIDKFDIIKQ